MISRLEALSAGYDRIATQAAVVLLGLMVAIVGLQVFFRYILVHPLTWSEEVSTFIFAWVIFLGATMLIRRDQAPALLVFVDRLQGRAHGIAVLLRDAIALAISIVLVVQGIISSNALTSQATPALQIPAGIPQIIMPLAGLGLVLHYLAKIAHRDESRATLALAALAVAALLVLPRIVPPELSVATLLAALLAGFVLGLPVAMVLLGAVIVMLVNQGGLPLAIVPQTLFTGASNFILMAVPFFMLTGAIMQNGGLAQRLIDFSSSLVGRFRGGLLLVDVVASAFFADISGSAVADTAAIGSVMLPGMVRRGYDPRFATALQAASGTLGVLFPPSIATIVYAWVANVSVAEMFLASFVPAILMVISFCTVAMVAAIRHDYPREAAAGSREILHAFRNAFWALLAPVIIVGGILKGIVTPPEAGVVAVVYTVLISAFRYRTIDAATMRESMVAGVLGTGRVMFILSAAILLSWLLTILQLPQQLSAAMLGFSKNPLLLLLILNVLLVMIHGVLETNATLILIVPLVLPVLTKVGISPIHLGIIFLVNSALGLLTPPLGLLLYVAAPITGLRIEVLARAMVPFLLTVLVDLALVVLFPQISTALPALFAPR